MEGYTTLTGVALTEAIQRMQERLEDGAYKEIPFSHGLTAINPEYLLEKLTELFGPCGIGWILNPGEMQMGGESRTSAQGRDYYVHIADFTAATFCYCYEIDGKRDLSNPIPASGSGENESRAWAIRSALTSCLGTAAKWLCWQLPLYQKKWAFGWSQGQERSQGIGTGATNGAGQQAPAGQPGLWVMPFGKHKGKTLNEIYTDEETRGYLSWIMVNISDKPDITDAVRTFLTAMEEQTEKADTRHWIEDPNARARFWAWTGSLTLSNAQVHEALGVEHIKDFDGTMGAAKTRVQKWIGEQVDGVAGHALKA